MSNRRRNKRRNRRSPRSNTKYRTKKSAPDNDTYRDDYGTYDERPSEKHIDNIRTRQQKQDLIFVSVIIILLFGVVAGYFYISAEINNNNDGSEGTNTQNEGVGDGDDGDDNNNNNDNDEIVWTSYEEGLGQASNQNKPVIIDFYTDWCGYCKEMDKNTYDDGAVISKAESFICVKVDGDQRGDLISSYGITGYPTTVFLNPRGEEIHRKVGYIGPEQFIEDMDFALNNS